MGTRTLLTFEDFERLPDDGMKHELIEGEHVVMPPPKLRHTRIQRKLSDLLRPFILQHALGELEIEAGFRMSPGTWLQPDVSFVRAARAAEADPDDYYRGAPALAVEVVSESNPASLLDRKIDAYFQSGAEEVWVVYPKTRKVRVHYPDGHSETFANTELRSRLFPGWSAAVSALFE